jgi:hypothetical protein
MLAMVTPTGLSAVLLYCGLTIGADGQTTTATFRACPRCDRRRRTGSFSYRPETADGTAANRHQRRAQRVYGHLPANRFLRHFYGVQGFKT